MNVLVAPDSFGGWQSATAIAARVATRLQRAGHRAAVHPMSDGGEGLLDALAAHHPLSLGDTRSIGPHRGAITVPVGRWGGVWLESARVIGLSLAQQPRAPLDATSAGLGRLVDAVADQGDPIHIGLGGSATVDGGLGFAGAMGLRALDFCGRTVPTWSGAARLADVAQLVGQPRRLPMGSSVLVDVHTTVSDAITAFGPQKGVPAEARDALTAALVNWCSVVDQWRAGHGLPPVPHHLAGGGAAGGLGFALAALTDLRLRPGAEVFADTTSLDEAILSADVVVTGEGRLDHTSFEGKVVGVVARRARALERPCFAVVGTSSVQESPLLDGVFPSDPGADRAAGLAWAVDALAAKLA